jgi:hypothetical protein
VRRPWTLFLILGLIAGPALYAEAQTAPVPPEPAEEKEKPAEEPKDEPAKNGKEKEKEEEDKDGDGDADVAPGFSDGEDSIETPVKADKKKAAREAAKKKKGKYVGRDTGLEDPPEDFFKPVQVNDQGPNDRLIADINAATGEVALAELIDEILADVMAEIDTRPARWWSPMAIRQVNLGDNVRGAFADKLRSMITAQIHAGTDVRMLDCVECEATTTRVEGDQWIVTNGIATTEDTRRVADLIGVKAFLDVSFGFDPSTGILEMDFRVVRARDSFVLWSDSFRADEETPVIARSSEAPIKRRDRLRDLEMLLEGRPYYGIATFAGFMLIPHNDPVEGDIGGATAGFRVYERFGVERRIMFGLDLTGFLNTSRIAGGLISAGTWWVPIRPDFVNPELRLGAKAGAFIAGSAGNAAVFQLGAELLLRYRFGLYGYVLFMTKSEFPPDSGTELGGVGFATGISFNW